MNMATFIKKETKKTGVRYTCWNLDFSYIESCRNVYLRKSVFKNGQKSTVAAYARAAGLDIQGSILTANVYFWSPAYHSHGRRYNENKRNAELERYIIDNAEEVVSSANKEFSSMLLKGEKLEYDNDGIFLSYKGEKWHFGDAILNQKSFTEARDRIRIRRTNTAITYLKTKAAAATKKADEDAFYKKCKQTFVYIEDSIKAGNCPHGTKLFYNSLPLVKKGFKIVAVRADVLLQYRKDAYVLRAVNYALSRVENK